MAQANCPNCGAELKDEYGMQNCRSCGMVVLIDFDGNIRMATDEPTEEPEVPTQLGPPPAAEPAFDLSAPAPALEPLGAPSPDLQQDQSEFNNAWSSPEPLAVPEDIPNPAELAPMPAVEPIASPVMDPPPEAEINLFDMPAGSPLETKPEGPPPAEGFGPPGDPLGMNNFANSEASQARDGLYLFKLTIDGIDSKEIRDSLREALEDSRFGWDAASVISRIDKGRLVLDRMAAVKASVAVQRIKNLPIRVRWEQFIVTDEEAQS